MTLERLLKKVTKQKWLLVVVVATIIVICAAIAIVVTSPWSRKPKDSSGMPISRLITTIDIGDKYDYTQLQDFSVNDSGYSIISEGELKFINKDGSNAWSKSTSNDGQTISYVFVTSSEDYVIAGFRKNEPSAPELLNKENSTYVLQKFDANGAEVWQFELPKLVKVNQIVVDTLGYVYVNGVFMGGTSINNHIINSYGKADILKITIKADALPEIINYTQIGSSEDDSIKGNFNSYSHEDVLFLGGPATVSSPRNETQHINVPHGTYYCQCGGIASNNKNYPVSAVTPLLNDNAHGIGATSTGTKSGSVINDRSYILTETRPEWTYDEEQSDDINSDKKKVDYYIESQNKFNEAIYPVRKINQDFSVESDTNTVLKPYAIATTNDSVAVISEGLGAEMRLVIYDKMLNNRGSIAINGSALTTNSLRSNGGKYFVLVFAESYMDDTKAKIYEITP